ncbi:MAG: aldehyde dehydrogenase family protein [Rhizobacter sp.]|nr:aldehyde dehydrogenase family protein [Chlorobiales bacterium]
MTYQLYINGGFRAAFSGKTYSVHNPSDNSVMAEVALAGKADADAAIDAAREAFDNGAWRNFSREERSMCLKKLSDKITELTPLLVELEAKNSGSTVRKSKEDVFLSAKCLNVYSKYALKELNEDLADVSKAGMSRNVVRYEPLGVVAAIIPWNFPLKMAVWKLGPALAAGNTVVLKVAPDTPLSVLELAKHISDCGFPAGVINVITGDAETGDAMTSSLKVDKVAFTGSTEVGKKVMMSAAGTLKKITLELGGKSANIVLDDADFSIAVDGVLYGIFYHSGQCCEAGSRLLLHEKIYDAFLEKLVERTKRLKIGDAMEKSTEVGPLVSKKQQERVLRYIELGKSEGAKVLTGGGVPAGFEAGCYIEPTVFEVADNKSRLAQEEIFGPVLVVIKVKDDADAVRVANESIYGLGGAVWSQSDERAMNVASQLRTGTVWINEYHLLSERAVFGGYKQSGIGREFGVEGLKEYMEAKHIHIDEARTRDKKPWYNTVVSPA